MKHGARWIEIEDVENFLDKLRILSENLLKIDRSVYLLEIRRESIVAVCID